MVFQQNFNSPSFGTRMCLGYALVLCDVYGLFPQSGQFLIHTVEVLLNYLRLKTPFLTFCGRDLITHLNH